MKTTFFNSKYAIGVASVLIGLALVGQWLADTVTSEDQTITASADTARTTSENHPVKKK